MQAKSALSPWSKVHCENELEGFDVFAREDSVATVVSAMDKLLGYNFEAWYRPGSESKVVDAPLQLPPTVHLAHFLVPVILHVDVVKKKKKEVLDDPKLSMIIQ